MSKDEKNKNIQEEKEEIKEISEANINYEGEGFKVRIFDLTKGLTEYEHIKVVRIISKDYNLLIMQDYLPIIGEIDGRIDIRNEEINLSYKHIQAFYMNSNNIFILMIKELIEE